MTTNPNEKIFNERTQLNLCKSFIEFKFDELEGYAESLEKYLDNEVRALEARHKVQTSTMTAEQKEDFYDFASDEYFQLTEAFPKTLRISFFVHSYSLFEHSLNEIANTTGRARGIKITTKDLRDEGITRAKNFLKKLSWLIFQIHSRFGAKSWL